MVAHTPGGLGSNLPQKHRYAWKYFVGTKWCGPGNRAKDIDDLGFNYHTDICCRAHDRCPEDIKVGTTRLGFTNNGSFTTSHCECDLEFEKCLKNAGFYIPRLVKWAYFSLLEMQCFVQIKNLNKEGKADVLVTNLEAYKSYKENAARLIIPMIIPEDHIYRKLTNSTK
ncbi:hypothetical protein Ciccas_001741 [Cichlidogyrus casuarinus]|uniref:Phospholipase A2-like central domain-containing protein n=1 Tax=Cichlidogyrus casuarinus TaxID=1844966 RepID=A0ABD2QJ67_9PLAT